MEVSVIMPVCNSQKYIIRAVKSAIGQNFDDFELIIVNYGSTDDSRLICAQFEKRCGKIRIVDCDENCIYSALNMGLREAKGNFIVFAPCEGFYYESYLFDLYKKQMATKADIIIFGVKLIDAVIKKELCFSPSDYCGDVKGLLENYKNI